MVSIAESLNYRIFERKWRPGEASNGHPRACRIAQCRTKTQPLKRVLACQGLSPAPVAVGWRPSGYPEFNASHRRFMGNSHSLYSRLRCRLGDACKRDQQAKLHYLTCCHKHSFVTDLSAAGSPAELKHITQRRKRKQP